MLAPLLQLQESVATLATLPASITLPLPIFGVLAATYLLAAPRFPDERSRAYILATISSFLMTTASLPFLCAYITGGLEAAWDLGQSGWGQTLANCVVTGFGTYLFADLFIGYFAYRAQVGFLTGWVHHIAYIGVMAHLATSKQSPIFLTGAIMELPTFDLAISHLKPTVRSDERFLTLMILTRIIFNAVLLADCARPSGRVTTEGSWVPAIILGLALTLHLSWMHGGIKGYLKRRRQAKEKKAEAATTEKLATERLAPLDSLTVPNTPDFGAPTPEESPLVTPYTPSQPSVTIRDNFFPNIAMPTMANLPIPNIPTLSGMAAALPQAKANLNNLHFGFKDAVLERWEEQRERFSAAGMMRLRRRAPGDTGDDILVG